MGLKTSSSKFKDTRSSWTQTGRCYSLRSLNQTDVWQDTRLTSYRSAQASRVNQNTQKQKNPNVVRVHPLSVCLNVQTRGKSAHFHRSSRGSQGTKLPLRSSISVTLLSPRCFSFDVLLGKKNINNKRVVVLKPSHMYNYFSKLRR